MEKTKYDGATPQQTPDVRLQAAMVAFAERFEGANTNGNMVFEFDPVALSVENRLLFFNLQVLIELLVQAGLPAVALATRFAERVEAETEKLRKPTVAASVGSIIRR